MAKYYWCSLLLSVISTAYAIADPTQPMTSAEFAMIDSVGSQGLVLNAIITRGRQQTVIINGQILQLRQTINGYSVIKIDAEQITLQAKDGQTIQLHLPQSIRQEGNSA